MFIGLLLFFAFVGDFGLKLFILKTGLPTIGLIREEVGWVNGTTLAGLDVLDPGPRTHQINGELKIVVLANYEFNIIENVFFHAGLKGHT